jgi:glycosyltransferase involved in cell wall biosynthesis
VKILVVSKILVVAAYRHKLDEIAARPEVERVVAVTGPAWYEPGGRTLVFEPSPADATPNYEVRVEPIRFNGSYHLFYWPALGRVIREVRPDLVHLDEEPYNLATLHGARQASGAGVPSLFFTWQNLLRHYPPPFRWFEQDVFRRSSHAIAGSDEALEVLRHKGYRGSASVIPQFGVDPELFAPAATPPPGPPVIGFISRLVEEKGVFVLLDALAGLRGDWRLHVIGAGPLEARARERSAQLGFADRVTWERGVPSVEVPDRLRRFTVYVQPSLTRRNWKEQFGRALMESMACGVPVIGSSSGAIPNVVGDGGLVVDEGDPLQLRDALARVLDDCALRSELGRRGRARVLECFTNARIAEQTVSAYLTALGGHILDPALYRR